MRMRQARGGRAVALDASGRSSPRASRVMGHVGLTPQSAHDARRLQGAGQRAARRAQLLADALALEAAGCFAIVLEAVPARSPRASRSSSIPTIGIGAGPRCDGQVLVCHDLLGLTEGRRRASSSATQTSPTRSAARSGVRARGAQRCLPAEEHTYPMPAEELELFSETTTADVERVDRSFQTDVRAEPARPDAGTASGASADGVEHAHRDS